MPQSIKHAFQYGGAWWDYYQQHKDHLRPSIVDNVTKMLSCGLAVRGGACYSCPNPECTHTKYVRFTCKSRFCTACGKKATSAWIQQQMTTLPKTDWQHITFTMPKTLWRLFKLNRHLLNQLSGQAAHAIQTLAKKKGIMPGMFTALHTFGRDLKWNTHIHLSTTRGGLTQDRTQFKPLYFKKESVMRIWRYNVVTLLRRAEQNGELILPKSLRSLCPGANEFNIWLDRQYQKRWIVHCAKPSDKHWHNVNYLGRYIKRPPLAGSRLKHYDGKNVVFRYLNHKTNQHQNFFCSAHAFIERFIQHIPDKGFRLIRYYGFLSNRLKGTLLNKVYTLIQQTITSGLPPRWNHLLKKEFGFDPLACILCQSRLKLERISVGLSSKQLKNEHEKLALMKPIYT